MEGYSEGDWDGSSACASVRFGFVARCLGVACSGAGGVVVEWVCLVVVVVDGLCVVVVVVGSVVAVVAVVFNVGDVSCECAVRDFVAYVGGVLCWLFVRVFVYLVVGSC